MQNALASAFRRVCWLGEMPPQEPQIPTLFYMNHHTFYDGHVIWLMGYKLRQRMPIVWMERWAQFPFLGLLGAMPFPKDNPRERLKIMQRTQAFFTQNPNADFYIFPEARQHPPEQGILPFYGNGLARVEKLFPQRIWCPLALHTTWWNDSRPTLLLTAGEAHETLDGQEAARLERAWRRLQVPELPPYQVVFEGKTSADDRWNFSFLQPFFRHKP